LLDSRRRLPLLRRHEIHTRARSVNRSVALLAKLSLHDSLGNGQAFQKAAHTARLTGELPSYLSRDNDIAEYDISTQMLDFRAHAKPQPERLITDALPAPCNDLPLLGFIAPQISIAGRKQNGEL